MSQTIVYLVVTGGYEPETVRVFSDQATAQAYADIENEGHTRSDSEWHEVDDLWLDTELPSHVRVWTKWCNFTSSLSQNEDHEGSKIVWEGGFVPESPMVKSQSNRGAYWLSVEGVDLEAVRSEYAFERALVKEEMESAHRIATQAEIDRLSSMATARANESFGR